MSAKGYRLSPLAEADLEDIWLYTFKKWSLEQADNYHRDLVTMINDLAMGHKAGRVADVRDGYFKQIVGAHVIYFRRTDDGIDVIDVIRILHGRMDISRHL